jgi:threonine synthase
MKPILIQLDPQTFDALNRTAAPGKRQCEPASAATLAGLKKLISRGTVSSDADVVAVLTGNVLKDPDVRYHTGQLEAPGGAKIVSTYGNRSIVVPNDADAIAKVL